MQFFEDKAKLQAAEEQKFIEACQEEFTETSLAAANLKKVRQLTLASYLPNVFSAITAGFFVWYILSDYSQAIALILGFLLLSIVVAVEAGKRGLITSSAKEYYTTGKAPALALVALLACFALSMAASYTGGKQLVVETAPPPAREVNPQIDSLNQVLAAQEATIAHLQRTTWKGKVTRKAQAGINEAKKLQNQVYARIATLEAQDDETHAEVVAKHTNKRLNFGYVLGILAALADFALLGLLWTAKRLKWQVAAIHQLEGRPQGNQPQPSVNMPTISSPAPSLNQSQNQIGFKLPQAKAPTENRRADEPPQPETAPTENRITENRRGEAQPEVVTVVEREVVELTDRVKTCLHCGERFVYYNSRAKYCSDTCRVAAWETRTGKTFGKRQKG